MVKIRLMGKKEDMHQMIKNYIRLRILKSWKYQIFTPIKVQANMAEFI